MKKKVDVVVGALEMWIGRGSDSEDWVPCRVNCDFGQRGLEDKDRR